MGFWENVGEYFGEVVNRSNYKTGFMDGYNGNPRKSYLLNDEYYTAGYLDGKSSRESGQTF